MLSFEVNKDVYNYRTFPMILLRSSNSQVINVAMRKRNFFAILAIRFHLENDFFSEITQKGKHRANFVQFIDFRTLHTATWNAGKRPLEDRSFARRGKRRLLASAQVNLTTSIVFVTRLILNYLLRFYTQPAPCFKPHNGQLSGRRSHLIDCNFIA